LAASPILLLLGSLLLAVWRPSARRVAWLTEVGFTVAALVASLFLRRSIPTSVEFDYLPPGLSASLGVGLELTSWSWSLLVGALVFMLAQTLKTEPVTQHKSVAERSAWLGFAGFLALSILAANILALVLTWTLVLVAQAWRARATETESVPTWGFFSGVDLAALACLLAAGAVSVDDSSPTFQPAVVFALLVGAGGFRLASGLRLGRSIPSPAMGDGERLRIGGLTAVSVLAMAAAGIGQEGARLLDGWLILFGAAVVLLTAASLWLAPKGEVQPHVWILSLTGAAALAAGVSPPNAELAFSASGAVLIVVAALAGGGAGGDLAGRVGAIIGALTSAGIPYLVGAMLLGVLSTPGERYWGASLRWLGVLGMATLSSKLLHDGLSAARVGGAETAPAARSAIAAVLVSVFSAGMFAYLRPFGPPPATLAIVISLAIMVVGVVSAAAISSEGRARLARSLRWPRSVDLSRGGRAIGLVLERAARGLRDVLEGDASLLWAFVVLLVGFLAVRASR
jgi:hypothetical protein